MTDIDRDSIAFRKLGYVEGKNIAIEWCRHGGRVDRLPELAMELARLKVDLIVSPGFGTDSSKEANSAIPIVMTQDTDPGADGAKRHRFC